jgi:RNA-directed DNA polymerase
MNDRGKSDSPVVPAKPPNKAARAAAEVVEGRGLAKGSTAGKTRSGHRAGQDASSALDRVRRVAVQDKEARFTALLHHVSVERLRAAYLACRPQAAAGVDGVTWEAYGEDLEANLQDLHRRLHRGAYRAKPSRRAYIPKADGRLRPLGIATLEDKIVQRAVVEVLNAIYEADFLGFSYGFRTVFASAAFMATSYSGIDFGCGIGVRRERERGPWPADDAARYPTPPNRPRARASRPGAQFPGLG